MRKETDLERKKVFGQMTGADVRSGAAELVTLGPSLPDSPIFQVCQICGQVQGQQYTHFSRTSFKKPPMSSFIQKYVM